MLIDFPQRPGAVLRSVPGPSLSGLTALETYLDQILSSRPADASQRAVYAAASRLSRLLSWHEIEVITDPRHVPGTRRDNEFWTEVERLSATESNAAVKMLARGILASIREHEETVLAGCHL